MTRSSETLLRHVLVRFCPSGLSGAPGLTWGKAVFGVGFGTGDLSEWSATGTWGLNATPGNVQVVSDIVQEGKWVEPKEGGGKRGPVNGRAGFDPRVTITIWNTDNWATPASRFQR